MHPLVVPAELSLRRRRRLRRIPSEPVANDVVIKLFAPEKASIALARDFLRFLIDSGRRYRVIEFVRLFHALGKNLVEIGKGIGPNFAFR